MCSFLITNILRFTINYVNYYLKFRGPDATNEKIIKKIKFIHNLLHITGERVLQPFIADNENIVALFNGEIYNYLEFNNLTEQLYKSDGECLIPLYKKYGDNFIKQLHGEFAIVLFDFKRKLIILSTDIFSTKPLWYSFDKEKHTFAIASYASAISRLGFEEKNITQLAPNTTLFINLKKFKIKSNMTRTVYDFDLKQHKNSFDDWTKAFQKAINIRILNSSFPFFIGLSSGYDSGSICCCLNNIDCKYESYSIYGGENVKTIEERIELNDQHGNKGNITNVTLENYQEMTQILKENCEDFHHYVLPNNQRPYSILNDGASAGMAIIFKEAKKKGYKYFLSGQGADEIFSDYGHNGIKIKPHSFFGGKFPEKLEGFFPWHSVFDGVQKCFLAKEEYVSGAFGIEGRYPFLDKNVVQEFLWLTPELKNSFYKAPLYNFLTHQEYPFNPNMKVGFSKPWN